MVDELELAVLGTSCKYNQTKECTNYKASSKGYNLATTLYYTPCPPNPCHPPAQPSSTLAKKTDQKKTDQKKTDQQKTDQQKTDQKKTDQNGGESSSASHLGCQDNTPTTKKSENKKQPSEEKNNEEFKPKIALPGHIEPTYYIGGGNGNALIEDVMNDLGWRRIKDKLDDNYTLKWCEVKQTINYNTFKEGDQLVNHIPNCNLLTNKLGLLNSLQEYSRVCGSVKKRVPKLDFIPETYRLDDLREREVFREKWKENDVWICKPTGRNQGKGIFLVKNKEEFDQLLQDSDDRNQQQQQGKSSKAMNRIIQRYIQNPLLLNNKKFDIRAYMLVGSTVPFLVLYHKGYVRLSMFEYEDKYENLAVHLTNQYIQRKEAIYKDKKEDTVWTMEKCNEYINEHFMEDKRLEKDWANNVLPGRMKQIMTYCFNAVKHRLHCKTGFFDLYGFDFMVDSDMKTWLIEVNVNPCLATNCEVLKNVLPPIVKETLYIAIDCFEKGRRGKAIMPCQGISNFEVIFHGGGTGSKTSRTASPVRQTGQQQRSRSISPVRRPRTISPSKEMTQQSADNYAQNRRGFLLMRPGLMPSPTNLYGARPAGPVLTTQTNSSRSGNGPSQLRSPYAQDKALPSRTPIPISADKMQQLKTDKATSKDLPSSKTQKEDKGHDQVKVQSTDKQTQQTTLGIVRKSEKPAQATSDSSNKSPKIVPKPESKSSREASVKVDSCSPKTSPKTDAKSQHGQSQKGEQVKVLALKSLRDNLGKVGGKQATATKTDKNNEKINNKTGANKTNVSNNNNAAKSAVQPTASTSSNSGVPYKTANDSTTKNNGFDVKQHRGS